MTTSTKTALLIIDMHKIFLPMTKTCLLNIIKISQHFTSKGWPQFFTQHGHPDSGFREPITNQLVKKWCIDGSIHYGSHNWELIPNIKKLVEEARQDLEKDFREKNVYGAFIGADLEERLRREGVQRVVIVSVMTDCCCDTTGRGAFNRGFEKWMVSDGMGSADKTQHEAGLKAWGFGYGDVIDTEEVLKRLG
ncbi:Isochorismatase hydrolase [Setomelanomma holmii]|uniref:Isochorismatase hydrolase n=1 Tax=Setomelanomma holmii TaxID=210430 RepID=A0A9P4LML2_9PLEO|nr:Isochorismatase hydrolase [Setomelanomma holmii]